MDNKEILQIKEEDGVLPDSTYRVRNKLING